MDVKVERYSPPNVTIHIRVKRKHNYAKNVLRAASIMHYARSTPSSRHTLPKFMPIHDAAYQWMCV